MALFIVTKYVDQRPIMEHMNRTLRRGFWYSRFARKKGFFVEGEHQHRDLC
jgi:hypothetical protein